MGTHFVVRSPAVRHVVHVHVLSATIVFVTYIKFLSPEDKFHILNNSIGGMFGNTGLSKNVENLFVLLYSICTLERAY